MNNLLERFRRAKDAFMLNPKVLRIRWNARKVDSHLGEKGRVIFYTSIAIFLIFIIFYFIFWRAPHNFPNQALVSVERGKSVSEIAESFEKQGVIRSSFWLKTFIKITGGERRVVSGDYYFPDKVNTFGIVKALHKGKFGLIPIKVTIHEGLNSFEIGELLSKNLPAFNKEDFIEEVKNDKYEGYLFPDTYFFMPNTKASDVILMMRENFARNIKDYEADIIKSGKTLNDLIIMASIIEDEANTLETKRVVSGILWKRMSKNIPLQVDAPFKYYNGKNSYTLTKEDLKEDHDYNTYTRKGLPKTAISNPGIDSIRASIAPTNTQYFYFLTDKSGNMYFAKDFEGHQHNREMYLHQ